RGAGTDSPREVDDGVGTARMFSGNESGGALITRCNTVGFIDGSRSAGRGGGRGWSAAMSLSSFGSSGGMSPLIEGGLGGRGDSSGAGEIVGSAFGDSRLGTRSNFVGA